MKKTVACKHQMLPWYLRNNDYGGTKERDYNSLLIPIVAFKWNQNQNLLLNSSLKTLYSKHLATLVIQKHGYIAIQRLAWATRDLFQKRSNSPWLEKDTGVNLQSYTLSQLPRIQKQFSSNSHSHNFANCQRKSSLIF